MPGAVMNPKVLRRVKDRTKTEESPEERPVGRKGRPPKKRPVGRKGRPPKERPVDLSPGAEEPERKETTGMAKGGMVCSGMGAASRGGRFTRNG